MVQNSAPLTYPADSDPDPVEQPPDQRHRALKSAQQTPYLLVREHYRQPRRPLRPQCIHFAQWTLNTLPKKNNSAEKP
jgi:hypothetical protein